MQGILFSLGDAYFSLSTRSLESLERKATFVWSKHDLINLRPTYEFNGRGEEDLSLRGTIFPLFEPSGEGGSVIGIEQMRLLHRMAANGIPYPLIDGIGRHWGLYVITCINEHLSVFFDNGTFRKQEFDMALSYYPDPKVDGAAVSGIGPVGAGAFAGNTIF